MLIPINWLKKYLHISKDPKELADALTLSGSNVESLRYWDGNADHIVLGKIVDLLEHPNADKLVICHVDVGDQKVKIVTGAPNVYKGAMVAAALPGAVLDDGLKIEARDFRGERSFGMLCSYEELGFEDSVIPRAYRDGVLIFNDDFKPGTPISQALDLDDVVIEFEITPNRPDCLSVIGMAREVAATTNTEIELPKVSFDKSFGEDLFERVSIQTPKCSYASLRVIEDLVIGESPNWLQNYLMKAGMRPLNNIVDLTNFVMLETGQPLHAYDLDKISGKVLYIRDGREGEVVKTIDGEDRKVLTSDIVIADKDGPVGLGGVMGGFDAEVGPDTRRILLESAVFDKDSIRKTSERLQLRSEASNRFEKGVDKKSSVYALDRVCSLAQEIFNAKISQELHVQDNSENQEVRIPIDYEIIDSLLGLDLSKEAIYEYMERLNIGVVSEDGQDYAIPPSYRKDLSIKEDIAEEVGRLYGFHNIKPLPLEGEFGIGSISMDKKIDERLKSTLKGLGFSETVSYSFVSPRQNTKARLKPELYKDNIEIKNPLGEEFSVMRSSIMPNALDILSKNQKNGADRFSIFELGNVFYKDQDQYIQDKKLVMAEYGDVDFYKFKGKFLELFYRVGIEGVEFSSESDSPFFHPGRCAKVYYDNKEVAILGEVSYELMDSYAFRDRVYIAEVDIEVLYPYAKLQRLYKPYIRFPKVVRDLAFVVDRDLKAKDIEEAIKSVDSDLIQEVILFDVYMGSQIESDKKSMAYEIVYASPVKTLKDEEVNQVEAEIMDRLESQLGISLRK